jgi:hypothetical protein
MSHEKHVENPGRGNDRVFQDVGRSSRVNRELRRGRKEESMHDRLMLPYHLICVILLESHRMLVQHSVKCLSLTTEADKQGNPPIIGRCLMRPFATIVND